MRIGTIVTVKATILLISLIFLISKNAISQDFRLGTPHIVNHNKEEYRAGAQSWSVKYKDGHIFFANNGGLLYYNGINWLCLPTPENTLMRSLNVTHPSRIYTGAQNEIGYFSMNLKGQLDYINLKDSINLETYKVSEIWDIVYCRESVFFSSENHIYQYQSGIIKEYGQSSTITKMSLLENDVWYHTAEDGIYIIEDQDEFKLKSSENLSGYNVIELLKVQDNFYYIVTEKHGIFKYQDAIIEGWKTNADKFLTEKRASSAYYDPEYGLFIGTYLGGLISINENGQCQLLLNKQNGLQNNTINCIALSPNNVLWLGTNNGIDEIDLSISFRKFNPDNELEGAVYDLDIWNGFYFFSTSHGLYYLEKKEYYNPLKEHKFKLVPGTSGQTWGTDIIGNQLFCAHHEGAFKINSKLQAEKISDEIGIWKFIKLNDQIVAAGTYQGLSLYKIGKNGSLNYYRKISGLDESARILTLDKFENLWVSHPYKKVYQIQFNQDYSSHEVKEYDKNNGFQSDVRNYVFNINDICFLTNETGVYKYNEQLDSFVSATSINKFFEEGNHVRRLIQKGNDIWCISDDFTAKLNYKQSGLENRIDIDTLEGLNTVDTYIGGFEELFPVDSDRIFISTIEGAIEYNPNIGRTSRTKLSIKKISLLLPQDSVIYGGLGLLQKYKLGAKEKSIRIEFQTEFPNSNKEIKYSVKLDGLDEEWSNWNETPFKEYSSLNHGTYSFELKAKVENKLIEETAFFEFEIEAPWYLSWPAKLFYFFSCISVILAILLIPRKRYQENTAQLEAEKRKTEEEIEIIRKEKLLDEINYKNKELASSTLQLLQKNQTLNTLRSKFDELNEQIKNPKISKELNKIISIFRSDLRLDEDWDKFGLYFDQVHQDFIKNLKSNYPKLSTNDHKLCAYLKMNLSTKEIAPLLNISVRGVEISRYRLRKKLNLERSVNLNEFFDKM